MKETRNYISLSAVQIAIFADSLKHRVHFLFDFPFIFIYIKRSMGRKKSKGESAR